MAKTIHVIPATNGWAVKREDRKSTAVFQTQKEAIESARSMARGLTSGQLVVHGKDGRIRDHFTYGMPRVQDPHGRHSVVIEKAVGRIVRNRLEGDSHSKRDQAPQQ
jgi:hypothetical protein